MPLDRCTRQASRDLLHVSYDDGWARGTTLRFVGGRHTCSPGGMMHAACTHEGAGPSQLTLLDHALQVRGESGKKEMGR